MTGLLIGVMHEHADTLPAPDIDLDAIVAEGERQVRRQRLGTGLVAAARAGPKPPTARSVPRHLGGEEVSPASRGAFAEGSITYALGRHIYWDGHALDVGRPVASYVATDNGFVYTSADGGVWLYDGTSSAWIGNAQDNRLRADDQGSLVSWVETAEDGHARFVVYDAAAHARVARVDDEPADTSVSPDEAGAKVFAVDDGSVYWRHDAQLARYDIPSDRESVLAAEPGTEILDVSYGTLAFTAGTGQGAGAAVAQTLDPEAPVVARASDVLLSPNARYLATQVGDDIAVYDLGSGEDVTPDTSGYPSAAVVDWVDPGSATVLGVRRTDDAGHASGDVLRCDIRDECTVEGTFAVADGEELVAPTGEPAS